MKRVSIWVSVLAFLLAQPSSGGTPGRVLMIVNEGFWAPEHFEPRKELEKAGFLITVAAKKAGAIRPDDRNTGFPAVEAQIPFAAVQVENYDAIVFAGGNGAWTDYFPSDEAHRILKDSLAMGKVTALLCSSTGLLAIAGNFDGQTPLAAGRHVTGYFRVRGILEKQGLLRYDPGPAGKPYVVVDGGLITGRDPQSSRLFGETIAGVLRARRK